MYKLVLISKYLRRKLAPMFAALAVTLCTMMVIIVISVMGGFLDLLRASAQRLSGDVIVSAGSFTGFPYYQELIDAIDALPEAEAATPIIRSYGLLKLGDRNNPVEVEGILPEGYDRVVGYKQSLYWTTQKMLDAFDHRYEPPLDEYEQSYRDKLAEQDLVEFGMTFDPPAARKQRAGRDDLDAIVLGIEISPRNQRDEQGRYDINRSSISDDVTLTVLPLTSEGGVLDLEIKPRPFAVVNEFKSGLYDVDANRVYVRLDTLQKMLLMDAWEKLDDEGFPTGEKTQPRVTEVLVKAAPGVPLEALRRAVDGAVRKVQRRHADMPVLFTMTWEERHRTLLSAVQNEKGMVTFLFVIISVVAVVMVGTTLYMIVLEKTRDIGILRAIGASRLGIANVFLGYGLAIGIIGALIGAGLAYLIVNNLNGIQEWLAAWFGWRMWNPQTYYFDRIPDEVKTTDAVAIGIGAVISCVVGALISAFIAARQDPIEALRHE